MQKNLNGKQQFLGSFAGIMWGFERKKNSYVEGCVEVEDQKTSLEVM